MNSIEFADSAAEAICEWGKHHNEPCYLDQHEGVVICLSLKKIKKYIDPKLKIDRMEILTGLSARRWTQLGTALHNLYCKDLACSKNITSQSPPLKSPGKTSTS